MRFAVLCGGVGGAKFCDGVAISTGAENLTAIVNVGDDFDLYGLRISPDLDSVMYALGGVANPETGWGIAGDTWENFERLKAIGAEPWFRLGDRDLATHLFRTQRLSGGASLSAVTHAMCNAHGIRSRILPATDDRLRTVVKTDGGTLDFQTYFVRHQCKPVVRSLWFDGADEARPNGAVIDALETAETIFIGPSNPYLSLDPILAMPIVRDTLFNATAPIIAITPIIQGKAVKGPAAKLMAELGHDVSAVSVARHYGHFINGFVLDERDAALKPKIEDMGIKVHVTDTLMNTRDDRARLACEAVSFADELRPEKLGGCKLPA